jgi:hypothetical protein
MPRSETPPESPGYLHGFPPATNVAPDAGLTYVLDAERNILRQQWRGTIRPVDVVAYWQRLIADEATLAIGHHLNDLRQCRLEFSGEQWLSMIAGVLERMPAHAPWRAAIVVDSAATAGTVRQFLGYAGDLVVAQVFLCMDEAEAWLLDE